MQLFDYVVSEEGPAEPAKKRRIGEKPRERVSWKPGEGRASRSGSL